jgi:hypothetical protein
MQSQRTKMTTVGGASEEALFSAKKKSSLEAWAGQLPRSANPIPIVEEFSHRVYPWDSAHALPGISWWLQSSKRPIFRLVFRRRNRLSQALAGSRKHDREWELFAPAPAGLIFLLTSSRARNSPVWKLQISSASGPVLAPKLCTHPTLPLRTASGPGGSHFGCA